MIGSLGELLGPKELEITEWLNNSGGKKYWERINTERIVEINEEK